MQEIPFIYRNMLAQLVDDAGDAEFVSSFASRGSFKKRRRGDKDYWYFAETIHGERRERYVGPVEDAEVARRVDEFETLKSRLSDRRKMVRSLVREAGLPAPDQITGEIVERLAEAGLFRLRCVLVGSVAYSCYSGVLGVKLPSAQMQTGDMDFAQFHSISEQMGDEIANIETLLQSIDPTFSAIPSASDKTRATQIINKAGYKVEFLTPNQSKEEYGDKPARMPALGPISAQPLRFLDFLIHDPIKTVLLYKAGVPVVVPDPARYAVHKLIVASRRKDIGHGWAKRDKDLVQAQTLAEALEHTHREQDIAEAWIDAWGRGNGWRRALEQGLALIPPEEAERFMRVVQRGCEGLGESFADVRPSATRQEEGHGGPPPP